MYCWRKFQIFISTILMIMFVSFHIFIDFFFFSNISVVSRLQEQFPAVSRTLVNMALDSSNYDVDRAKQFLAAMTPQDR